MAMALVTIGVTIVVLMFVKRTTGDISAG
jgi:hypothetical protein